MAKSTKRIDKDNDINLINAESKAFFEEVDEEVKNEQFKKFINKYGGVVLTFLIIAISIVVGYEKFVQWNISKDEAKNILYVQALTPTSNYEDNISELENIVATEKGLYKDVARLQIANILLDNQQKDRALEVLTSIYTDNTVSEKIREIATIKLATYKVDTANFEELNEFLAPIANDENSAWKNMAQELLAMSAIQNKNFALAKDIYNKILNDSSISDEFKSRINDMLASINDAENM